ncbi:MAG: tetratricopeptide repeat protein [Deltaproteobacteria bacterium]|nr:tetratricopeptide repeat protein [Deltaproteobacteria bacterium]
MEAVCKTCNISLKLPQAALPSGARLFCPKCSRPLEIRGDGPASQPPGAQSQPPQPAPQAPAVQAPPAPRLSQPPAPQAATSWDQFLANLPSSPPVPLQAPLQPPPTGPRPAAPQQFAVPGFDAAVSASDRLTIPMMPTVSVTAAGPSTALGANPAAAAQIQIQIVQPGAPFPAAQAQPPAPQPAPKIASATEQLFSEDIVPDTELSGDDVDKLRQNLFVKADSVWYGAPDEAPRTDALPPSAPSGPPKIPPGTGPQPQGYIKATDSIQVDPSLFAPVEKKEFQAPPPATGLDRPPEVAAAGAPGMAAVSSLSRGIELDVKDAGSGSIELAVTVPPHPAVSPQSPSLDHDEKVHHPAVRQQSGPIRLVASAPRKQFNITIPAVVVGVLMVSAGLFWILAGRTDSKDKFDIAAVPKTGVLPSAGGSASVKTSPVVEKKPEEKQPVAVEEKQGEKKEDPPVQEEKAKVAKKASSAAAKEKDEPKTPPKDTGKKAAQEHYSLGNQYFMQQRFDMAAEEYKQAVRSDGSYAYAYRGLGAAYARLGKADLAVKQYEMYIKLVPNAPDAEQVKKIINDYYGK